MLTFVHTAEELEEKNRKRRERAALARQKKKAAKAGDTSITEGTETFVEAAATEAVVKKGEGEGAEGPSEDIIKEAVAAAAAAVASEAARKADAFISV
jgi:hypothetical protein